MQKKTEIEKSEQETNNIKFNKEFLHVFNFEKSEQ